MCVHGVQLEVLALEQRRQRATHVVGAEPEPIHPGVDLQMVVDALLIPLGGSLHRRRGTGCRNRRREPAVEQTVEVAHAQRAKDQDFRLHARLAQRVPFLDIRARKEIRSGLFECQRHLPRAVPVRVRFHDRDHARSAIASFGGEMLDDVPVV